MLMPLMEHLWRQNSSTQPTTTNNNNVNDKKKNGESHNSIMTSEYLIPNIIIFDNFNNSIWIGRNGRFMCIYVCTTKFSTIPNGWWYFSEGLPNIRHQRRNEFWKGAEKICKSVGKAIKNSGGIFLVRHAPNGHLNAIQWRITEVDDDCEVNFCWFCIGNSAEVVLGFYAVSDRWKQFYWRALLDLLHIYRWMLLSISANSHIIIFFTMQSW